MKKTLLLALVALTVLYSCNDDETVDFNPKKETKSYMPLQAGNYWIYDVYFINHNGKEEFGFSDTLTVLDEIKTIKGKKYNQLEEKISNKNFQNQFNNSITTDSLGYIITEKGNAIFSNINFTDTINYTYFNPSNNLEFEHRIAGVMKKINTATVPAGSFNNVLDFEQSIYRLSAPLSDGTGSNKNPKTIHTYYAKNVGIVFHTSVYLVSGDVIEWRLAKYQINGKTYPQE